MMVVSLVIVHICGLCVAEQASDEGGVRPVGKVEEVKTGFTFTEGPAWSQQGSLFFTDIPNAKIHLLSEKSNALSTFTSESGHANGILVDASNRILVCQMDGRVVQYDADTAKYEVLADKYEGKRFNAPNDLIVDKVGGIYFTDPLFRAPQPLPQGIQAVYYINPRGKVSRLTDDIAAPNGIALSPDGKRLYVIPSRQAEMLVYDVTGPGKIANGRVLCRLKQPQGKDNTGGDGMAIDVEGNLYITTNLGVEIFSQAGKHLGLVAFPQQPANVTFGGADRKTMYVTARTGLYRIAMPIAGLKPN
ncbi:MAG: gluconolactonase [Rhodopirellula sp.]|nr:gluconolactonase [Rhodopirellula sp.]MAI74327.1 gluconolactonase [Rhodopirellula sp.]OUX49144.1 MAG: gluconolactonase [Rhodopirellula sp. TMED283]